MSLCPNCRRLDADPGSVHNRGRLVFVRTAAGEPPSNDAPRIYTCRNCGAVWDLRFSARFPRMPLLAERWSLRKSLSPRESA